MSSRLIDNFIFDGSNQPWERVSSAGNLPQPGEHSPQTFALETLARVPSYISEGNRVMRVGAEVFRDDNNTWAFIKKTFNPPLNLINDEEIRFWLRCDRGSQPPSSLEQPFYLKFEAGNNNPKLAWQRLLPVTQENVWELHCLWLADMDSSLKQSIQYFQIQCDRSLNLAMGDLIATTLEPLRDVEQELQDRLVRISNLPVVIELPETKLGKPVPSCIVITLWAVQPMRERGGCGDLVDNYVPSRNGIAGAYVRPVPWLTQLDYSIDVYAQDRLQKSQILTAILQEFDRQPYLRISGVPLMLLPFTPAPEETASHVSPGRSPLFYRITIPVEQGERHFYPSASLALELNIAESTTPSEILVP